MRRFLFALALLMAVVTIPAMAADVGVSVQVGEPGFYGRIDIGNFPPPQVIYPQPVVIQPVREVHKPIYLHVPPGHAKNWHKHCRKYNACGQPVYFVRDSWVRERYEHEHPGWERGRHRGWDKHHDKHDRDDDRGRGHGHGNKHRD